MLLEVGKAFGIERINTQFSKTAGYMVKIFIPLCSLSSKWANYPFLLSPTRKGKSVYYPTLCRLVVQNTEQKNK